MTEDEKIKESKDEKKSDRKSEKSSGDEEQPLAEPVAPKSPPPPPQQSAYPPPQQGQYYQQAPFEPATMANDRMIFTAIIVGMIFMLIGSMISVASVEIDDVDGMRHALTAGGIFFNLGGFILALYLIVAGVFRNDMNNHVRLGMLIASGLIILKLVTSAFTLF